MTARSNVQSVFDTVSKNVVLKWKLAVKLELWLTHLLDSIWSHQVIKHPVFCQVSNALLPSPHHLIPDTDMHQLRVHRTSYFPEVPHRTGRVSLCSSGSSCSTVTNDFAGSKWILLFPVVLSVQTEQCNPFAPVPYCRIASSGAEHLMFLHGTRRVNFSNFPSSPSQNLTC